MCHATAFWHTARSYLLLKTDNHWFSCSSLVHMHISVSQPYQWFSCTSLVRNLINGSRAYPWFTT